MCTLAAARPLLEEATRNRVATGPRELASNCLTLGDIKAVIGLQEHQAETQSSTTTNDSFQIDVGSRPVNAPQFDPTQLGVELYCRILNACNIEHDAIDIFVIDDDDIKEYHLQQMMSYLLDHDILAQYFREILVRLNIANIDAGELEGFYHLILQQAIRQDPLHYAFMVAMQPDDEWRLVSFPILSGTRDCLRDLAEIECLGFFIRSPNGERPLSCFTTVRVAQDSSIAQPQACWNYFQSVGEAGPELQGWNVDCLAPSVDEAGNQASCELDSNARSPLVAPCLDIGRALIGQVDWYRTGVQDELKILLEGDGETVKSYVEGVRRRIQRAMLNAYDEFEFYHRNVSVS